MWAKMDSNHRRRKPADLQSAPFVHSGICPFQKVFSKKSDSLENYLILLRAEDGAQTRDPQLGRPYALNFFEIEITN